MGKIHPLSNRSKFKRKRTQLNFCHLCLISFILGHLSQRFFIDALGQPVSSLTHGVSFVRSKEQAATGVT